MMKMFKALAITGTLLLSQAVLAQNVTIRGVRLSGSGCDAAAASAITTPDGKTLSVLFDNYFAEIGQGSENPQSTTLKKDCHVLIDVDVPFGYQYAINQTEYRGFAAMPKSAYGLHRFTHIVPGAPIVSMREAQLYGPLNSNYNVIVTTKPGREVYSQCNNKFQTIDLYSQLQVAYLPGSSDRSIAMINLDSVDTGVNSKFKLIWRKCK
jgi:Domain of unknown function (DUF4360)